MRTRSGSSVSATRTSTIARPHPRVLLLVTWIDPFGTVLSVPSYCRTIVTRSVSPSTVPVTGPPSVCRSSTSPTSNCPSSAMNSPANVSFTTVCAPNPSATPAIPALANNGPSGTPART